jgi:flagellar hook assembly protein FlgD
MVASGAAIVRATPNPFTDRVELRLRVPTAGETDIAIFDASGRRVRSLYHGLLEPGEHEFTWNGRGERDAPIPDGVYFARMRTGDGPATSCRVVLTR